MKNILLIIFLVFSYAGAAQEICSNSFSFNSPWEICANNAFTLTMQGPSGVNFSVEWEFADGTSYTGNPVTHTFINVPPATNGMLTFVRANVKVNSNGGGFSKGYTCTKQGQASTICLIIDPIPEEVIPPGNPFLTGEEGNWRLKRNWLLHVERNQTRGGTNDNVNLRTDGTYKNFYSFWAPSAVEGALWSKQNETKWTFKTQINYYNPFGTFELENVDPLNRYSAAVYGYNRTLPVAVASNARYREIAFDSFEDYDYGRCENNHFSFQFVNGIENMIDESNSHSGRKSIRVGADKTVIMKKEFAKCPEEEKPVIIR